MSILIGEDSEEERFRRFTDDLALIVNTHDRGDDWALKQVKTPFAEESTYAGIIENIYNIVRESNVPEIFKRIDNLLKDENHAIRDLSELLEIDQQCMQYAKLLHETMYEVYLIEHHQEKQRELPEHIRKLNCEQAIFDVCLLLEMGNPTNRSNISAKMRELEKIRETYLYDISPRVEYISCGSQPKRYYKA